MAIPDFQSVMRPLEFLAFHTHTPTQPKTEPADTNLCDTPDEQLQRAHASLMDSLADELLDTITAATPAFFEKLVVDLMLAMGYGGSREDAGQATCYTSDGGAGRASHETDDRHVPAAAIKCGCLS
jgi:restriction system protein